MPFVSRSQSAACFAKKRRNQAKGWNCSEWASHTDYSHLPEHKKSTKKASLSVVDRLAVLAASLGTRP